MIWTFKNIFYAILLIIYLFFCVLMYNIIAQYLPYNTDVAFLRIKQDYINIPFYKLSFFVHVYTSILVLPAGFTQFSSFIKNYYKPIHKYMGWLYIIVVLVFAAPSGIVIGIFANGGVFSQIGFILLGVLWFAFTFLAIFYIFKKKYVLHNKYMLRSFALSLSAITLRAWKYLIVAIWQPPPMDVYRIVAWLGWVLNLVIIEIIIFKNFKK